VNNYGKPARVSGVEIDEIYPEPQEKRFFIIVQSKDRERFPCDSKVQGFNLVNPDEIVEIEVRPLRPLKEEYGYEITVLRQLSDEEQERQWDRHGPFVAYDRGVPAAYVYRNGRLEEPQAKSESFPTDVENKFCIHCGAQISSTAKYCLKCGEKQTFEYFRSRVFSVTIIHSECSA